MPITPERQRIIEGSLHAATPEEREHLRAYIKRTGLDTLFADRTRPPHNDHDYEGAILDRQAADQF